MAKQSGIHQLNGKLRGVSYYRQKYVKDGLARTINEGMSDRVKNAPEYANTRKNASEFGASGSTVGAGIRVLSKKWRYILNPFATGMAQKDMLRILKQDTTGDWGERGFEGAAWKDALCAAITAQSKNSFVQDVKPLPVAVKAATTAGNVAVISNTPYVATDFQNLAARGAEGIVIELYRVKVTPSTFVDPEVGYSKATSDFVLVSDSGQIEIGGAGDINLAGSFKGTIAEFQDDAPDMSAMLMVCLPYKVINNTAYTLQELCSARIIRPEVQE